MQIGDAELDLFRREVSCAALLGVLARRLAARSPGKHPSRPEIPPRRGRDPDHQPRRTRLVGPAELRQGRCVRPGAASRSELELRAGAQRTPAAGWCGTGVSRGIAAVTLGRARSPGCRPLEASAEATTGVACLVLSFRAASRSSFDPDSRGRRGHRAGWSVRQRLVRPSRRRRQLSVTSRFAAPIIKAP